MLQRQIKQNEKGGVLSTDGKPSPYNTAMTEALKKPEKWFYHGEPLFFEGNTILGTLCMSNHTGFPNNFKNLQESGFFRDKINELSSALKVQGEQRWKLTLHKFNSYRLLAQRCHCKRLNVSSRDVRIPAGLLILLRLGFLTLWVANHATEFESDEVRASS